ncbi:hypothetical protein [Neptunitalea chrysea]|nr:hypothetical protein [Neptunitalea chrysea]
MCITLLGFTTTKAQSTTDEIINTFFQKYKISTDEAVDYVFQTNPYFAGNDGVDNVKLRINNVKPLLGDYLGEEVLSTKKLGSSYVLITYIVKYDREPLRFQFQLYKPRDKWQLYNFKFDENVWEEFEGYEPKAP